MGLEIKDERNVTFVGTYGGFFTKRTTKDDLAENVISRDLQKGPNAGTRIYEQQFSKLSGVFESVFTEDSDFGKRWVFQLQDDGEIFKLSFPYNSNNAKQILFRLPNIDLLEPIELLIFYEKEHVDDKGKSIPGRNVIWAKQNNAKVSMMKHADWNGLPDLEEIVVNNEKKWDSTKRNTFLEEYVNNQVMPMIDALHDAGNEASDPEHQVMPDQDLYQDREMPSSAQAEDVPPPTDEDGLPF